MKCSICKEKVTADPFGWEGGANAEPINEGRCCHLCGTRVVLPARLTASGFKEKQITTIVEHMIITEGGKNGI